MFLKGKTILQGTVLYLNSGASPAVGVKICAAGANACFTTVSGSFYLEFPDKKPGEIVQLTIGGQDKSGALLELVNAKELSQVRIPQNADEDFVEVIVCKIGQRNDAASRYNALIIKTINKNVERRLKEIQKKRKGFKNKGEQLTALLKEKEFVEKERDAALAKASEHALFIASINLDKTSQQSKNAIHKIDHGQDINDAIAALDNEILLDTYYGVTRSNRQISAIIEAFKLKIILLGITFQYPEVIRCCQELTRINREQGFDSIQDCFDYPKTDPAASGQDKPLIIFGSSSCNKIGDVAVNFSLKNVDGKRVSLTDYPNAKGIILIFMSNHCAFSQLYEDRIIALHQKFAPLGYPVVAINPNSPLLVPEDSFEKMQERATAKNYPFAYLIDEDQTVYPAYGATRTPQVFILDENRVLRFSGAIDNNAESPSNITSYWTEDALYSLIKGVSPAPATTRSVGCTIKKAPRI